MPIVINDFEIVVEPPPARPQSTDAAPALGASQPIRPDEIVAVVEVREERLERVRAD